MSATMKEGMAPVGGDETSLPTGVQLTALDEAFRNDPYPILDRLRSVEPIHRDQALQRWFVTSYDVAREVLRDKDLSSDLRNAGPGSYMDRVGTNAGASAIAILLESMIFKDDPDHRRLRALLSRAFSPTAVADLRPRIRANVSELLDTITDARFDVVEAYSDPLPVIVISDMMGVERELRATFKTWSEDVTFGFFNPLKDKERTERGERAIRALNDYFLEVIQSRRRKPDNDLISLLVTASEADERMTDEQIVAQCDLVLVAGNITTSDLIANSLKALLGHPGQLEALREKPELIASAIEEVLRYESSVTQAHRTVMADTSIAGCPMHKGDTIGLSLAGVNRDPQANPNPHAFDIRRTDIRHQSFGGGKHLCLGAHLARVEAQEAVLGIVQRFPKLTLVDQAFEYRPVPGFRALEQLWVSRE